MKRHSVNLKDCKILIQITEKVRRSYLRSIIVSEPDKTSDDRGIVDLVTGRVLSVPFR